MGKTVLNQIWIFLVVVLSKSTQRIAASFSEPMLLWRTDWLADGGQWLYEL
jgi:hypothetical protein